ncbi:hypothetical protein [Bacterioplanoides sp.]|uniref:hypothetical protein n=1 Tax=Bacterioplanoides sp. TaxID=2066072 RepID=UPI003B59EB4A
MNRLFFIAFASIALQGCPVTFTAYLKNDSNGEINVTPPFETDYLWHIPSGEEGQVNWYQECIIIRKGNNTEYYSGWPIPDNTVNNGVFGSSLSVVYKDDQLYFKTHSNELIKVAKVKKCSNGS